MHQPLLPYAWTRRHALQAGVGLLAPLSRFGAGRPAVAAGTPEATPAGELPAWLFVMTFRTADLVGDGGQASTLTLTGVHEHVIAFTDRPARDVSLLTVDTMVALINDAAEVERNPLNATLAVSAVQGEEPELLVMVLEAAAWEAGDQTAVMEVTITGGEHHGTPVARGNLIEEGWTEGFLFIDPGISRMLEPTPVLGE